MKKVPHTFSKRNEDIAGLGRSNPYSTKQFVSFIIENVVNGKTFKHGAYLPIQNGYSYFSTLRHLVWLKHETIEALRNQSVDKVLEELRDAIQSAEDFGLVRTEDGTVITGAVMSENGVVLTKE